MSAANPTIRQTMAILLIVLMMLTLSSLVSIMYTFVGGAAGSMDAAELNNLQILGIVIAGAVIAASLVYFFRHSDTPLTALWNNAPGWLMFIILILNLLVLAGEVSYLLIFARDTAVGSWQNHVALICLALASTGFGTLFAWRNAYSGRPPFDKSRW